MPKNGLAAILWRLGHLLLPLGHLWRLCRAVQDFTCSSRNLHGFHPAAYPIRIEHSAKKRHNPLLTGMINTRIYGLFHISGISPDIAPGIRYGYPQFWLSAIDIMRRGGGGYPHRTKVRKSGYPQKTGWRGSWRRGYYVNSFAISRPRPRICV